jgi:hypothetical protein
VSASFAFCPHPPVLVPEVAQGAAPELDELRAACRAAIEQVTSTGAAVVVLGSAERTRHHEATARGTLAGFGVPFEIGLGTDETEAAADLPLPLTIGAWLLREVVGPESGATGWSVGAEFPELPEDAAVVVMGDGSARRSTAAPGYLDPRGADHDAALARALADGDPAALAAIDPDDLLVAGTSAWRAAAAAAQGTAWTGEVLYADAPYGVGYVVATWRR